MFFYIYIYIYIYIYRADLNIISGINKLCGQIHKVPHFCVLQEVLDSSCVFQLLQAEVDVFIKLSLHIHEGRYGVSNPWNKDLSCVVNQTSC